MIEFFPSKSIAEREEKPVFAILIPTWNNLPYLQFCVSSILKNSRYKHQIIIHVNDGSDGTKKWVEEQHLCHSWSDQNVGVCYAFNAAASLAKTDYLLLLDDDNYLLPDWDYYIHKEIEELGHPYYAISATKIEYKKTLNTCVIASHDFGKTLEDFKEDDLLEHYKTIEKADWYGSSWYPMAIHRSVWDIVGGLSIEYSPGMYSDPDFMMKLWHAGVRYFKGLGQSRSYHFMSKSVSRIKKNNGRKQFLLKWRMSNSAFRRYYLKMGEPFEGPITDQPTIPALKRLKDRIKLFFTI
ncbi:MAG: glycosyltransferase [Bacteroidetes bacterium]|nr:glycosyltransferase [Bacteroidota bacterium]